MIKSLNRDPLFLISAPRAILEKKQELCDWNNGRRNLASGGNEDITWLLDKPGTMEKRALLAKPGT
jgi:hypothetical protein